MKQDDIKNEVCWFWHCFGKWELIDIDITYREKEYIAKGQKRVCKKCGYTQRERI